MMLNRARKKLPKLKSGDESSLLVLVEDSCASMFKGGFDVPNC